MKYDETIIEIEEKVLSVQYQKTNIKGEYPVLSDYIYKFLCNYGAYKC